jgi:hypothetical protein
MIPYTLPETLYSLKEKNVRFRESEVVVLNLIPETAFMLRNSRCRRIAKDTHNIERQPQTSLRKLRSVFIDFISGELD